MEKINAIDKTFNYLLSVEVKGRVEKGILIISILSFIIHLSLILVNESGYVNLGSNEDLLKNPIAAIYTPFSFILLYEVYLLIYYLPKSITTYISKQYEIITLIIIRRLFKDLSNLELTPDWFLNKDDLQFTYDILTSIILFLLIYLFFRYSRKTDYIKVAEKTPSLQLKRFITFKRFISISLVPIFVILAAYTFSDWIIDYVINHQDNGTSFKNINNIFFDEFFTILIIADVLLLLFSLFLTDKFHKVIRNSGFVISTILLRLSFSVEGLINNLMIITAVVFGLAIMMIHNLYENKK